MELLRPSGNRLPRTADLVRTPSTYLRSRPSSDCGHSFAHRFNKYLWSICQSRGWFWDKQADENACSLEGMTRWKPAWQLYEVKTSQDDGNVLEPGRAGRCLAHRHLRVPASLRVPHADQTGGFAWGQSCPRHPIPTWDSSGLHSLRQGPIQNTSF